MATPDARKDNEEFNFIVFGAVNRFRYTNHRGETELRKFVPHALRFGQTEFHPDDQWLLEGYDLDRQALRTYALANIQPR